ncbi:MAM domain-containing glycosylphosphatidylinositol anchor protein 2-like [Styela clava]
MRIQLVLVVILVTKLASSATSKKPKGVVGRCGLDDEGKAGLIASPNFPHANYPPDSVCNYTVTVAENSVIKFEFLYMDMEDGPTQKLSGCYADYVVITEDDNEESTMVGNQRFCGYDTPFNPVLTKGNKAYIWFRSDDTIEKEGFVIRWKAVQAPRETFACDFESRNGYCSGWRQLEPRSTIRWKVNRGQTRSSRRHWVTGPWYDHTKNNIGGSYVFAEATGMRQGDVTTLISPYFSMMKTERYCLSFWYHMYGSGIGTFAIYEVQTDGAQDPRFPLRGINIFLEAGEKGKSWQEGKLTLNRRAVPMRFIFEATRGNSYKGDIAIDDITITEDECQEPK